MTRCLCCGKAIQENAQGMALAPAWHKSCIRRFFGVNTLPELDISNASLTRIASESTRKGYTVPGVQKKMSLHLSSEGGISRLTLVNYPTGFILKPQTEEYTALPEAEYLVMQMARETGIATVPFALIQMEDPAGEKAYITKRIDRRFPKKDAPAELLAMEDFCQLEEHLTENKYLGSYERCAKLITRYSVQRGLDLSELFLRIVFSFAVGNSDMHLKNFSLIETSPGSGSYVLSQAYDLLPVNLIVPADPDQMALTLNGKKRNLHRKDFLRFADNAGISPEAAEKMIRKTVSMEGKYLELCDQSYLPAEMKQDFHALIQSRISVLAG